MKMLNEVLVLGRTIGQTFNIIFLNHSFKQDIDVFQSEYRLLFQRFPLLATKSALYSPRCLPQYLNV